MSSGKAIIWKGRKTAMFCEKTNLYSTSKDKGKGRG